jgi:hypothetical protein
VGSTIDFILSHIEDEAGRVCFFVGQVKKYESCIEVLLKRIEASISILPKVEMKMEVKSDSAKSKDILIVLSRKLSPTEGSKSIVKAIAPGPGVFFILW